MEKAKTESTAPDYEALMGGDGAEETPEETPEETTEETPEETSEETSEETEENTEETEEAAEEETAEESKEESGETEETEKTSEEEPAEADDDLGLSEEEASTLTEQTKAKISKRIGKFRHDLTEKEQLAATASERAEAAEAERDGLRTQLDSINRGEVLSSLGTNPVLGATEESEITEAETHWRGVKRFAQRHVSANLGENDNGEVIALRDKDANGNEVEYTQSQVRDRLEQAEDMLEITLPKARQLFEQREAAKGQVAKVAPDLLKKGTEANKAYVNMLRSVPGLSVLPNAAQVVADMLAGEKLRNSETTELTVGDRTFVLKGAAPAKPTKTPPKKVPVKPRPAAAPVAKEKVHGSFDQKAVSAADDPKAAAEEQYKNIV